MKLSLFNKISLLLVALGTLAFSPVPSSAATITFNTSVGKQPSGVGTITLTEMNANTVRVLVDLLPGYGFLNTGNDNKTPFSFTLGGTEAGVTATFLTPALGVFGSGAFSLNLGGGDNNPYGSYGVAIDSSAGNGSSNAHFGDLQFDLFRPTGLTAASFVTNAGGYYFAADLTDGKDTGAQAWRTPTARDVPDGGATVAMLGLALAGIATVRRFQTKK